MPIVVILAAVLIQASGASSIGSISATRHEANLTISNASSYIRTVNESSYLVFRPDLSTAYSDLAIAESYETTSPGLAIAYADEAQSAAQSAYNGTVMCQSLAVPINSNTGGCYKRQVSLIALVSFTVMTIILLRIFMRPVSKKVRAKYNRYTK
ncbi:MAG: hypothetical protein KGH72_03240 [Candidatus Micrarchaeota archaeon]|nr:hypothetical protein [Candidatus Micrarchaeota archaeon]